MSVAKLSEQTHYSLIRIAGADSAKFLQGQLSCDLDAISDTQASLGGYCNVQGRLFAVFYLLKEQDDFLMLLPSDIAESTLQRLSMFAVFFQAELSICEGYRFFAQASENTENSYLLTQHSQYSSIAIQGADLYLVKPQVALETIEAVFSEQNLSDENFWNYAQIQAGIPMVYQATIEQLLPHYIGLSDESVAGVSFTKGCYTGQEVVARMHYRGTLKTHPAKAVINAEVVLVAGTVVTNAAEKKVGELIDSVVVDGKTHCLISLADKALDDELMVEGNLLQLS